MPEICKQYLEDYEKIPLTLSATHHTLEYYFKSNKIVEWISINDEDIKYDIYVFKIYEIKGKYKFIDDGAGTPSKIKIKYKDHPVTPLHINKNDPLKQDIASDNTDLLLVDYDTITKVFDYTKVLILTQNEPITSMKNTSYNLIPYIDKPLKVTFIKSFVQHDDTMGDYSQNRVSIINSKRKSINDIMEKYHSNSCKNLKLSKSVINDNNMKGIIKKILKNQDGICCDDIDLSKHVLKTSIVPCSNLIPEKYKKYAEKYKAGDNIDDDESEAVDIHVANVIDKFSIIYIVLIIFIVFIILLNIM